MCERERERKRDMVKYSDKYIHEHTEYRNIEHQKNPPKKQNHYKNKGITKGEKSAERNEETRKCKIAHKTTSANVGLIFLVLKWHNNSAC